jgi:spore coat protein U-like protein
VSSLRERPWWSGAVLALLLVCPAAALAEGSCTVSATGPAFGVYDPTDPNPLRSNGALTATCAWISGTATSFTLSIAYGAGNSGNDADRYMLSGANRLRYNIFTDSTYRMVRGHGSGRTQTDSATLVVSRGKPTVQVQLALFGEIPALQDVLPGSYTDTILVTLNY